MTTHGTNHDFVITARHEPAKIVIGLRDVIERYEAEGELWSRLEPLARQLGVEPVGPSGSTAYDPGYRARDVDVEVWFPVARAVEVQPPLNCHAVREHQVLSVRVVGNFSQIRPACEALARHVETAGITPTGPIFNVYHVLVGRDPGAEQNVIEVCLPVSQHVGGNRHRI